MNNVDIEQFLAIYSNWEYSDGRLRATYFFPSYSRAFAFLSEVAMESNKRNHHPITTQHYIEIKIELYSTDDGVITERDTSLAEFIHKLYAAHYG